MEKEGYDDQSDWSADQGVARGAKALAGRACPPVRLQGPPDGFGDRDRRAPRTAEELLLAVEKLGASLDYFTDPFLLVGEGRFSWRPNAMSAGDAERLRAERRALDRRVPRDRPAGRPDRRRCCAGRWDHAPPSASKTPWQAGERFVAEFELGDVPASAPRRGDGARSLASSCSWWMRFRAFPARPAACRNSMWC